MNTNLRVENNTKDLVSINDLFAFKNLLDYNNLLDITDMVARDINREDMVTNSFQVPKHYDCVFDLTLLPSLVFSKSFLEIFH